MTPHKLSNLLIACVFLSICRAHGSASLPLAHLYGYASVREGSDTNRAWHTAQSAQRYILPFFIKTAENSSGYFVLENSVRVYIGPKTFMHLSQNHVSEKKNYSVSLISGRAGYERPEELPHYTLEIVFSGVKVLTGKGKALFFFDSNNENGEILQIDGSVSIYPSIPLDSKTMAISDTIINLEEDKHFFIKKFKNSTRTLNKNLSAEWRFAFPDKKQREPGMLFELEKWP